MFHLYCFSTASGENEFIIISDEPKDDVADEYTMDGEFELDAVIQIPDANRFPCDRALRAHPMPA